MKATQISKENGVVKFNIEFTPEEWNEAIDKAYKANRNRFQIDGFRKGKAPRKIIESFYGRILKNITLDIYEGEFITFLGPS